MEPPSIRDLYPNLTEEELSEAEHSLDHYILLIARIAERLEQKGDKGQLP